MTHPQIKMLTAQDVAEVLNVSPMTVYRLIHDEELAAHRIGRSYRVDPRDFADYVRGTSTTGGDA